jgi:cystathionine gamma-synthase
LILNPKRKHHDILKQILTATHEELYFPDDAIVMARNCVDFSERVKAINHNAAAVVALLQSMPHLIQQVYYPSVGPGRAVYDSFRRPDGGYGYLVSFDMVTKAAAVAFFDALHVAKGPSLGTNFTLACPYSLFAHYRELEWAAGFGVQEHLVRISVGLENDIVERVRDALEAAEKVGGSSSSSSSSSSEELSSS